LRYGILNTNLYKYWIKALNDLLWCEMHHKANTYTLYNEVILLRSLNI